MKRQLVLSGSHQRKSLSTPLQSLYSRSSSTSFSSSFSSNGSTSNSNINDIIDNPSLVTFTHDEKTQIGTITLNSPSTYNALSVEMGNEFEALIHRLKNQINGHHSSSSSSSLKNLNVIILKGSKHNFSSGGDLHWLKKLRDNPVHINADKMYSFYRSFLSIRSLPIPTIAYVEGFAIGAGACLTLATDLRVMDSKAKIGFNFVKLGIHSGMGGSHLLPNLIGESKAKYALLTGQIFNAQEAYDSGLAHRIVTDNIDGDEVIQMAKDISSMHPLAVRSMVQTTRMREDAMGGMGGLDATLKREAYAQAICYAKDDWGEGLDAVVERRQPDFDTYHGNDGDW